MYAKSVMVQAKRTLRTLCGTLRSPRLSEIDKMRDTFDGNCEIASNPPQSTPSLTIMVERVGNFVPSFAQVYRMSITTEINYSGVIY